MPYLSVLIQGKKKSLNNRLKDLKSQKGPNWDWTEDYILLGTDVKSLFPSLSAKLSGKAIREQFEKSVICWNIVDWKLVTLYVKLQEKYWTNGELKSVNMYLPKRKSNMGRPPSIGTIGVENKFTWPQTIEFIPLKIQKLLMGLAMELAINFFFKNFCYTFGGKKFVQLHEGPIGARLGSK